MFQSSIVNFILFLFHPEDSGLAATAPGRRRHFSRFDNRLAGAAKIVFWIGIAILFWTGIPVICTTIAECFR